MLTGSHFTCMAAYSSKVHGSGWLSDNGCHFKTCVYVSSAARGLTLSLYKSFVVDLYIRHAVCLLTAAVVAGWSSTGQQSACRVSLACEAIETGARLLAWEASI